jgi:hypothetical protein
MSIDSLAGQSSTAAVRRPLFEVSFSGSGSGGASPASGALSGGDSDPWLQHVVAVSVDLAVAPSVNTVSVILAAGTQAPAVAPGDEGTVALGYEDDGAELLFTGTVESVSRNIHGQIRIVATDGGGALSRLRVNQSYEQQTAGDIVRDLAGRKEVSTDKVEDGLEFPHYVVDDRRSAYRHIAALGRKSGYQASFTPEGKLSFAPFPDGQAVQTFAYGDDILALEVTQSAPVVTGIGAVGEGAAGSQGQEAWSWLIKDPASVKGTSGESTLERLIQDPALRSQDAAQSAAEALVGAVSRLNITGRMLVPGSPAVVAASAVEISDAPHDALNGACQVLGVRHRFSKRDGFTTLITFSKTGNGGSGGLGGVP